MLTDKNMIDFFTDRIAIIFGAVTGAIFANIGVIEEMTIKLVCTILFSAIGAVVAFFVKRILDDYYKRKNKIT